MGLVMSMRSGGRDVDTRLPFDGGCKAQRSVCHAQRSSMANGLLLQFLAACGRKMEDGGVFRPQVHAEIANIERGTLIGVQRATKWIAADSGGESIFSKVKELVFPPQH